MNTKLLSAKIAELTIGKDTDLLLTFNFGKLHIQGVSQAVSVKDSGELVKGELVTIDKSIDFDDVDNGKLREAALNTVDDIFTLREGVTQEELVAYQFKTNCTTVAFKSLKEKCVTKGYCSESERLALSKLNNADKFINYLLPAIMCEEGAKRQQTSSAPDTEKALVALGLTDLFAGIEWEYIRYAADNGLTCWVSNKDWKSLSASRTNVTGKVGYILNGSIQVTLNDATRTKENEDGDEIISHRQARFSVVLS